MSTTPDPQEPRQDGSFPPPPPPPGATSAGPPAGASTPGGGPPPGYGHTGPPPGYGQSRPSGYGAPGGPGYGAPGSAYPPPTYGAPLSPSEQRTWAVLAHILTLILGFIAPLVVWLVYKDRGAFSEDQAKESLNFQITMTLAAIGLSIVTAVTLGLLGILFLPFVAFIVIVVIIAAIQAGQGVPFRYPLTYRFIK